MGMGKTIVSLALILDNPSPVNHKRFKPVYLNQDELNDEIFTNKKKVKNNFD